MKLWIFFSRKNGNKRDVNITTVSARTIKKHAHTHKIFDRLLSFFPFSMAKIHLIIQIKDKTPQIFVFFFLDFKLWMKRNCAILHNNRFFLFFRFICLLLYIVCGIDTRFFFSRRVFVQNCILTSMVCHFCYKYSYVFNCNRFRLSIQVLKGHVSLLLLPFRPWMSFRKDTKRIGQSNKNKKRISMFFYSPSISPIVFQFRI